MTQRADAGAHRESEAEERRHREAALDKTIEASFPASDPPSTDPNPDAHDVDENVVRNDRGTASERAREGLPVTADERGDRST